MRGRPENKEEAEHILRLYMEEGKSIVKIAEIYGVTRQAISERLNKFPEYKNRDGAPTSKRISDQMLKLYTEDGWTIRKIAKHFAISESNVKRRLSKFPEYKNCPNRSWRHKNEKKENA